jgi:hypothetical protein
MRLSCISSGAVENLRGSWIRLPKFDARFRLPRDMPVRLCQYQYMLNQTQMKQGVGTITQGRTGWIACFRPLDILAVLCTLKWAVRGYRNDTEKGDRGEISEDSIKQALASIGRKGRTISTLISRDPSKTTQYIQYVNTCMISTT